MSLEVVFRGAFLLFISLLLAWAVRKQYTNDSKSSLSAKSLTGRKERYQPFISGMTLPCYLLTILLLSGIVLGPRLAASPALSLCFAVFLQTCLYYLLLMPLLPFLRRHFSARACAALWLLPNLLYIFFYHNILELPAPLLVVPVPGRTVWVLFWLWSAGFSAVMVWHTVRHLLFRRHILSGSRYVSNNEVWKVWQKEMEDAGLIGKKYDLVISPHVHTPLTIGLYRRTSKVVLPEHSYTPEELSLIFRHEIIHIARQDAWNKFFLVFCTAMCWFNPLMWIAMRKSAEDLELSCDETVLLGVDDATRKQYAALLLDTTGDGRGYTTCLAASAGALRYRLKAVIHPVKRRCGALLVGLTFFLLSFSCGYVALAYGGATGADVIYGTPGVYSFSSIGISDSSGYQSCYAADEADLREYLSSLPLLELTGNYTFSETEQVFECSLYTPDNFTRIVLHGDVLLVQPLRNSGISAAYHIPGGVDWAKLRSLVLPEPVLRIKTDNAAAEGGQVIYRAHLYTIHRIEGEDRTLVYSDPLGSGAHCNALWSEVRSHQLTLSFSETPAIPYHIVVKDNRLEEICTIEQEDDLPQFTFTPIDQYARYVISTAYYDGFGVLYEAEYIFDVGSIG